jgi:excisionase family DNA binding protein
MVIIYTIEEIAKILKVTSRTIISYCNEGKLGSIKPSTRCTRITEKQLNAFLKKYVVKK